MVQCSNYYIYAPSNCETDFFQTTAKSCYLFGELLKNPNQMVVYPSGVVF